ncbi:unnamed protein product, partial [Ectocarpus sp. 12 AP-2014]
IEWDWVPNERVGPIRFGAPVTDYIKSLKLRVVVTDERLGPAQEQYEVPDAGVSVYVEDDRIDWVMCKERLQFQGKNLIGLTESDLETLFAGKPDQREEFDLSENDDEPPYEALDYDGLNVQVWMIEGRVETVSCSQDDEDDLAEA